MTTLTSRAPRTSRPLELAGPGERPASLNTQEGTHMLAQQNSPSVLWQTHPSGRTLFNDEYAECPLGKLAERDADAADFGAELDAVGESDVQLTELGLLFARVEAGHFSTVTDVGAAMRRIVGVQR